MQKVMMEHYGQWLLYQLRQWGWQGNLAVGLLLVSIVISIMIQANNEQAEKLRLTIDDLAQHTPVDIQPEPRSTQITQRFYQALPEQRQLGIAETGLSGGLMWYKRSLFLDHFLMSDYLF